VLFRSGCKRWLGTAPPEDEVETPHSLHLKAFFWVLEKRWLCLDLIFFLSITDFALIGKYLLFCLLMRFISLQEDEGCAERNRNNQEQ
jgi:hypothetical protein